MLSYAGCGTCKNALKWLKAQGIDVLVRPIVDEPPTVLELQQWIGRSGLPIRKWLNTSGQSYRALGKDKVDAASETTLLEWLSRDGKLVKRPVLITSQTGPKSVLVGFKEDEWKAAFAR
jgi:arsenate reductase